jgi:anti-sigma regulatory factor (Ser/Thr protein kinase)
MGDGIALLPVAASVAEARRWAAAQVGPVAGPAVAETAALLVSELVSNVVLHARTPCEVSIAHHGPALRVVVRDACDRMPRSAGAADPLAMSGRGLLLVEALSDAHGVERHAEGGKSVWFQVLVPSVERA